MIKVKHFMDPPEPDDGIRVWVEPIGLTRDLQEWCRVEQVLSHLGPSLQLWRWFASHPTGYPHFRGRYHEQLENGPYAMALRALAQAAVNENLTLLHAGDDPSRNSASALHEYLGELEARCRREGK